MEIQLELNLESPTPWDAGELPVTYVDYTFKRIGNSWLLDEELTLEALRGFSLGDVFMLEEVPNEGREKEKFPTLLSLKRIGKSLKAI